MTFIKANKGKKGGVNDKVYTPVNIAQQIINSLPIRENELLLEPCKGKGAFYDNFPLNCAKEYCELDEGKDFFDYNKKVDWIITNPPYSIFDAFVQHCFELSNNVVLLCPLSKIVSSLGRINLFNNFGNPVETQIVGASRCGFGFGFPCCSIWFKKDYKGDTKILMMNLKKN